MAYELKKNKLEEEIWGKKQLDYFLEKKKHSMENWKENNNRTMMVMGKTKGIFLPYIFVQFCGS